MGKGELTRTTILDNAVELAASIGLGGLTIGALATRTEMSKSGLFAHFHSKETLQLQVLAHARTLFTDLVIRPALTAPRGEPRVRELFERWAASDRIPGGCLFVKAATEFDDQPGPVRNELVRDHRDLLDTVAQVCRTAIAEGHFRPDVDPEQFAHDLYGILSVYYLTHRLLDDPNAEKRTRHAFETLLAAARA